MFIVPVERKGNFGKFFHKCPALQEIRRIYGYASKDKKKTKKQTIMWNGNNKRYVNKENNIYTSEMWSKWQCQIERIGMIQNVKYKK